MSARVLNLGCGRKLSAHPDVLNVDWSPYLRVHRRPLLRTLALRMLSGERRAFLQSIPGNVLAHDLRRGIPVADASVDCVYHSHMLEHLDRGAVVAFLREVRRVLRPGGIQRIVVPDLELLARDYLRHVEQCSVDAAASQAHDAFVEQMYEQSVRREAAAARDLAGLRLRLYTWLFGDARQRGETHQWMYDRYNLGQLLTDAGFAAVSVQTFQTSQVAGWEQYGLDLDSAGGPYKPGSLYLEATR